MVRRFEVLLPLRFNDGTSVPDDFVADTLVELEERFGGAGTFCQIVPRQLGRARSRGSALMSELLPRYLLGDTLWDFAGQPAYPSRAEFDAAVLRYHHEAQEDAPDIRPEDCWRPDDVALCCPRIVVRYYCDPPNQDESWPETELTSDDGASFTVGELFHKIHNAIIDQVRNNGHHWFEGLTFDGLTTAGVPIYCLIPGS